MEKFYNVCDFFDFGACFRHFTKSSYHFIKIFKIWNPKKTPSPYRRGSEWGGKTLTLIRHAKSDWSILGQNDFDRELSEKWKKQIKILKKFFKNNPPTFEKIIVSAAVRAKLTFNWIAKNFEKIPTEFSDEIYKIHNENIENFADFIRFFDDKYSHIAIVGHNPMFDNFIWEYTNSILHMPTGSVVKIIFDIENWAELKKWKIVEFFVPKVEK